MGNHTPLKLGVLANEFFDPELGRLGGFGWATRQLARLYADPAHGVELVFLTGELRPRSGERETRVHETRLILRSPWGAEMRRARAERLDLLLLVDYRPNYRRVCWALPRVPKIVWVRDPRPPEDVRRVDGLRIPAQEDVKPKGTLQPDCSSLRTLARASRWLRTPLLFASPASSLRAKLEGMIGADCVRDFLPLPNPIDLASGPVRKAERPLVLFLARRDPYKRPWLFAELARRFPGVDFAMAGRQHHFGRGAWRAEGLPPNLRLLGHVDGAAKERLLGDAWVLVNTSIHEGLAVSLLEGLAWETPLLSCVDPDRVASRFGIHVGDFPGSGEAALPALEKGLSRLLGDDSLRRALGRAGRRWVEETHTRERFLAEFARLCALAGVRPPASTALSARL